MFNKLTSIFIATLFASGGIASSEAIANRKLTPGLYRIVNPISGAWARNLPGPGHQGPWLSLIIMTTQFSSVYQTWNISHYEEGYRIRNYGSGNSVFSLGNEGDLVQGFSDGITKWYIESAGGSEYRVHYPNKDLVWTVQSEGTFGETLALKPARGEGTQVFQLNGPF